MFGVRDPEINAFAMPGGFIGVNTGLIVASASESELAAVLAHEIGHVVQRHIARGMTQQNQNSMVMLASLAARCWRRWLAVAATWRWAWPRSARPPPSTANWVFARRRTRGRPRRFPDADQGGLPAGHVRHVRRLMNASRLNEGMGGGSWASTPLSIERMSDAEPGALARRRGTWTAMISGTSAPRCAWCRARRGQSALGRAATAGRGPGAVRRAQVGGLLWPGLAGPAAQQPGRGGAQLDLASEDGRTSPQLARLSVDIALARKDNARALELAQAASKRWPDRRALGIAYAQALQNGGRHAEAQDYLRGKIRQWGADEPSLYQMLAQSERTGKPVQARRDMARYYTQIGAFAAASRSCSRRAGCLPTSTSSRRSTCRSKSGQTGGRAAAAERFKSG